MDTRTCFTLVHGWAWDKRLWQKLLPKLHQQYPHATTEIVDLGYFGAPCPPVALAGAQRIVIAHSYGTLWWLAQPELSWTALLAINGFPRLVAGPNCPSGVPVKTLQRMRQRCRTDTQALLCDFYRQCNSDCRPPDHSNVHALCQGLDHLLLGDACAQWIARAQDIYLLWGTQDQIVPPALSAQWANHLPSRHARSVDAGHLLPLDDAQCCVEALTRVMTLTTSRTQPA
jgi:pimeloyl-ACP methyl ester carboxylesterase